VGVGDGEGVGLGEGEGDGEGEGEGEGEGDGTPVGGIGTVANMGIPGKVRLLGMVGADVW